MHCRSTLATTVLAFLLATAFIVAGQFLPPGNIVTPTGIVLGVLALVAANSYSTLKSLANRVEQMERLVRDMRGGAISSAADPWLGEDAFRTGATASRPFGHRGSG
jgi:hypothetical protein